MKNDEFYESKQEEIVDKIAAALAIYNEAVRQGTSAEKLTELRNKLANDFIDEPHIYKAFTSQCKTSRLLFDYFTTKGTKQEKRARKQRKISNN